MEPLENQTRERKTEEGRAEGEREREDERKAETKWRCGTHQDHASLLGHGVVFRELVEADEVRHGDDVLALQDVDARHAQRQRVDHPTPEHLLLVATHEPETAGDRS